MRYQRWSVRGTAFRVILLTCPATASCHDEQVFQVWCCDTFNTFLSYGVH